MTASPKIKYKSIVRQLRRQQIENAALKAVLKHGFPGSTLRVVAREAKVPLSFAHYYFRDKEDLMRRVAERILARAIERLEQARGSERDPLRAARSGSRSLPRACSSRSIARAKIRSATHLIRSSLSRK